MTPHCVFLLGSLVLAALPGSLAQVPRTPFCDCGERYIPVCGDDQQTYGNACVAACFRTRVVRKGKCTPCPVVKNACVCNQFRYDPVCAGGLTWKNRCSAECSGRNCGRNGVCQNTAGDSFEPTIGGSGMDIVTAARSAAFPPRGSPRHRYDRALHMGLMFYESQRSGILPRHRFAWRGDSCTTCVGPMGEDISGGYFESGGSYLKMSMPSAFTVTNLAWTELAFRGGYGKTGKTGEVLDAVRWGADFLINSHPRPDKMIIMFGTANDDFGYYGPPEEKEMWVKNGFGTGCYASPTDPATEAIAESAAALAATSLMFRGRDDVYASLCLRHAKELYSFAKRFQGSYGDSQDPCIQEMAKLYTTDGYIDELAWGAGWLYAATKEQSYLNDTRLFYDQWKMQSGPGYVFNTNSKGPALHTLLYWQDSEMRDKYLTGAKQFFDQYLSLQIPHTPKGLAYPFHWGALRQATNVAFLGFVQASNMLKYKHDRTYATRLFNYAKHQVDYVLGSSGRSWLVGYGKNYPTHIWHKATTNPYIDWELRGQRLWMGRDQGPRTLKLDFNATFPTIVDMSKAQMEGNYSPQKFIAYGALFGAPMADDALMTNRRDFTYTEPTTEGQAGVTGCFAAMADYHHGTTVQNDCGLSLGWRHPNAKRAKRVNLC